MKFKDKDGNVFASMCSAYAVFCCNRVCESEECALYEPTEAANIECMDWAIDHPTEAARLMGYEVVEERPWQPQDLLDDLYLNDRHTTLCMARDHLKEHFSESEKEANMDKQKPRICEVLGVEVGERFAVEGFPDTKAIWIGAAGTYFTDPGQAKNSSYAMMYAIQHPESIIRKPRFTEEEVADARAIMRMFGADNWTHIMKDEDGYPSMTDGEGEDGETCWFSVGMAPKMFPSIRPGQSVRLSEIVGGAE